MLAFPPNHPALNNPERRDMKQCSEAEGGNSPGLRGPGETTHPVLNVAPVYGKKQICINSSDALANCKA